MYDVIIIGGGTAGLTAAIYVLRSGKTALVLEPEVYGGQITFSPRVENYPGFKSISGNEFADNLVTQALELGVETDIAKANAIVCGENEKTVVTDSGKYSAKAIIIATGAKHKHLGIENEERLEGCGVSYCAVCDGAFFKGQDVAVVGGGSAALQSASHLSAVANKVYLIHRRDEFRGEAYLAEHLKKKENIEFVLNSTVEKILGEDELSAVVVHNKLTDEEREISVNGLFVAIGQAPDNKAFASVVNVDENGYITAGEDCKTSREGIFVAGDCRTKAVRQLTTAAADGTTAALAACKYIDSL